MGTIQTYTTAEMDSIISQTVASGTRVGDNLQLTRKSGATFTAGPVKGPNGDPGTPGEVTNAAFNVQKAQYQPGAWGTFFMPSIWQATPAGNEPFRYRVCGDIVEFDGFVNYIGPPTTPGILIYMNLNGGTISATSLPAEMGPPSGAFSYSFGVYTNGRYSKQVYVYRLAGSSTIEMFLYAGNQQMLSGHFVSFTGAHYVIR